MPTTSTSVAKSPKRPLAAIGTNSRRSHPTSSKPIPRHKRVKINHNSDGSSEAPRHADGLDSTHPPVGESRESSSDQSAAKWFRNVNENVGTSGNKEEKHGDESPFYMAHQSSYHPSANLHSPNGESFGFRPRDETENSELRGVIDDLTVENKKLKNLLRNWQTRSSPPSAGPDRVIEIRMHGLPTEKKRELEQLLKTFATNLNGDTPSQPSSSTPWEKSVPSTEHGTSLGPKVVQDPTTTDSGYASISNRGLNSQYGGTKLREPVSKSKKVKDIKNYLHAIPDSLFPQETVSVSESAKMALVVQRLEQLFTGKMAAPGEHGSPLQQQKISQSASQADRRESQRLNRASKPEGPREAQILPHDSKVNLDAMDQERQPFSETTTQRPSNQLGSDLSSTETLGTNVDRPGSPDQRPTRPLDLDIHRAQIAADNAEYIRHLGLSSPHLEEDVETKDQPWMYLNLLVSMAQLHTLNVTPAFVRKAVKQLSTKFELSKDGHKIRWKGGAAETTRSSQQVSPGLATQRASKDAGDDGGRQSGRSAISTFNDRASTSLSDDKVTRRMASNTSRMVNSTSTSSLPFAHPSTRSKSSAFDYKPIVYQRKKNFPKAENSYLDSSSSYDDLSPDSSGLAHALSRSSLKSKDDPREGFMTFFSNPYFCTDLSGDKGPPGFKFHTYRRPVDALGMKKQRPQPEDENQRDAAACYFTCLGEGEQSHGPAECPDVNISFSPMTSAGEDETPPMEFPVSGLAGVRPEDNFALDVKVARTKRRDIDNRDGGHRGKRKRLNYSYQTAECRKFDLQPSRLPPPSYVFFTSSPSSSADKGYFSDEDGSESSEAEESPAPVGFWWQWSSSSNERQMGDDDYSEASSSLGVLEAARARLPNAGAGPAQNPDFIVDPSGRQVSGSLAVSVGASWSAASVVDQESGREPEGSLSSMSVAQGSN
ncbi:uncharacterized protein Z518_10042 [Rhinocladiella mackenziei CBS 650.93]|uniref:Frequency clock protein n=1 Tax=Rhinocladiella mackenziei CBS 650.93 TaxID=1442369 RepID=A0A0D2ICL1_9EURO|nr:uncharacterized protein Z518_10042 [Rhinocladiella mackenziei CBS 650.93]KIX00976.1 hypothetical protein Z518_10042 [Rhinocladiella mackenziei CBS 650.93]